MPNFFRIFSACDTEDQYLTVDADGLVKMAPRSEEASGLWAFVQGVLPSGRAAGIAIVNARTGTALHVRTADASVGLIGMNSLDDWSTWTFGGDEGQRRAAVRPYADSRVNLNVQGGCGDARRDLCVWRWSGGAANEVWSFEETAVTAPPLPQYFLTARCVGAAFIDPKGVVRYNNLAKAAPSLAWSLEVLFNRHREGGYSFSTILPVGSALVHPYSRKILVSQGFTAPSLSPEGEVRSREVVRSSSIFTFGGDEGGGFTAMRIEDGHLNIEGGCPAIPFRIGTAAVPVEETRPVILHEWQGAGDNQVWRFVPFPTQPGTR